MARKTASSEGAPPGRLAAAGLAIAPFVFLLFWSAGYPFAKIILKYSEPLTALATRYILVLLVMAAIALVVRPPMPRTGAQLGHMLVSSALLQVGYFGTCWYAFWLGTSSGTVALILSLQPILVSVLAPGLIGERISMVQWMGLVLGIAGAAAVILARLQVETISLLEYALVGAALASITASTLYEKRFVTPHHPVTVSLVQHLVGAGGTCWLAFALESCQVAWTAEFGVALAWFVVCNSLIAVSLLLYMIQKGEAARVSALFFMVPPTAALLSWLMLGETMPLLAWPGMALAGLGVILATRRPRLVEPRRPVHPHDQRLAPPVPPRALAPQAIHRPAR